MNEDNIKADKSKLIRVLTAFRFLEEKSFSWAAFMRQFHIDSADQEHHYEIQRVGKNQDG